MKDLFIALMVIWLVCGLGVVICVLLHSGKDAGLSDYFSNNTSSTVGTGIIEKNLDRVTIFFAIVFALSLLAMMVVLPRL